MADLSAEQIRQLAEHLFLPPQLSAAAEDSVSLDNALLRLTCQALGEFTSLLTGEQRKTLQHVTSALFQVLHLRDSKGALDEAKLLDALTSFNEAGQGAILPLHIKAQNAGVIFTKHGGAIEMETFELSPTNAAVISTVGRLRRCFPGPSLCVASDHFHDANLQSVLATTLVKMSSKEVSSMNKDGPTNNNQYDPPNPAMVTRLLISFFQPMSSPCFTKGIWKHTREEVLYRPASSPWRRSPLWLFVRVMMHLSCRPTDRMKSTRLYKSLMLHLLATALEKALGLGAYLSSDFLYCMSAKLVRRLLKYNDCEVGDHSTLFVRDVLHRTNLAIERRWSDIQLQNALDPDLENLRKLKFNEDTGIKIPELDKFILSFKARNIHPHDKNPNMASSALQELSAHRLPTLLMSQAMKQLPCHIFAFEEWTEQHLGGWLAHNRDEPETCQRLGKTMESYHSLGSRKYAGNPEGHSVMVLTLLDLWVACDRAAMSKFPMLEGYDPDIPRKALEYLLLTSKTHLERLHCIEKYLDTREEVATKSTVTSIFNGFGLRDSFAVKYFNQTNELKKLKATIISDAGAARRRTLAELAEKKEEWKQLMKAWTAGNCEWVQQKDRKNGKPSTQVTQQSAAKHEYASCGNCSFKRRAGRINMRTCEWPLPADEHEARSVVFELAAPPEFCAWRDSTSFLLQTVLGLTLTTKVRAGFGTKSQLSNRKALRSYVSEEPEHHWRPSHVRLACFGGRAENKFIRINENTSDSEACPENSLEFGYSYDGRAFVASLNASARGSGRTQEPILSDILLKSCTYTLPDICHPLQKFLTRRFSEDDCTPNAVIATQSACPPHMALREYRSLAAILVGYRLQWMNILAQIACPTIDMRKMETCMILLQAIYQAGPLKDEDYTEGSYRRACHSILADTVFAERLLNSADSAADRFQTNWESVYALSLLTSIICRQLALTTETALQDKALQTLSRLRGIAYGWTQNLRRRHDSTHDDDERDEFVDKIDLVALVCTGTFDVASKHQRSILSEEGQASILIECGILVHEYHKEVSGSVKGTLNGVFYRRWQRMSYQVRQTLMTTIVGKDGHTSLDVAVANFWTGFQRHSQWKPVKGGHLVQASGHGQMGENLGAHYDFVTGQLLVNGSPLSRLPPEYEQHKSYAELFSRSVFQVAQSKVPGMQFQSKHQFMGRSFYFGLEKSDMLVQIREDGTVFDRVPRRVFNGSLPKAFVDNFVHWYDRKTETVQLCKTTNHWPEVKRSSVWELEPGGKKTWVLSHKTRGTSEDTDGSSHVKSEVLINPRSPTGDSIAAVFRPLQRRLEMNLIMLEDDTLKIELPRVQLVFYLKQGSSSITSHQFRGFEVDPRQSIGTLAGLKSKLVLRDTKPENPEPKERRCIVPNGQVSFTRTPEHVSVSIRPEQGPTNVYKLDNILNILRDNGSLQSKLFLCYLHALTSFCLPDPFTQHTGTEQSLFILQGAAVKSFQRLTEENLSLLCQIESITPRRGRSAKGTAMQIIWNDQLHMLAQHPSFHVVVVDIIKQNSLAEFYSPETFVEIPEIYRGKCSPDQELLLRDQLRTCTFRTFGFGAEMATSEHDADYIARDTVECSKQADRCALMSSLLFHRKPSVHHWPSHESGLAAHMLHMMRKSGDLTVRGLDDISPNEIGYDSKYLEQQTSHWAKLLCWLHSQSVATIPQALGRYQLMMWFTVMAFPPGVDLDMMHTAASFFRIPGFQNIEIPEPGLYRIGKGDGFDREVIEIVLQEHEIPLEVCHPVFLPASKDAVDAPAESLEQRDTKSRERRRALRNFIDHISQQWPCAVPSEPVDDGESGIGSHIDLPKAMADIRTHFADWSRNREFGRYLKNVETAIADAIAAESGEPSPFQPVVQHAALEYTLVDQKSFLGFQDIFSATHDLGSPPATPRFSNVVPTCAAVMDVAQQLQNASMGNELANMLAEGLRMSAQSFASGQKPAVIDFDDKSTQLRLEEHLKDAMTHVQSLLDHMLSSILAHLEDQSFALNYGARISRVFLLQQLTKIGMRQDVGWDHLSVVWRKWIVAFGLALTEVQRARRLLDSSVSEKDRKKDHENDGHTHWDVMRYPETLLLEVENNLLIREVQAVTAQRMSEPPDMKSTIIQLAMGEGKSSVIVPMVVAALADRSKLVRVIVTKPQLRQMLHELISKFGGLVNRRVFTMPFTRSLQLTENTVNMIREQCQTCIDVGGVLLVQPEHILSFKLMGLEAIISGKDTLGKSLLKTQHFFDTLSRDVVDESDENFSPKFELIYTMGTPGPLEFGSSRWTTIQKVLDSIRLNVMEVQRQLPDSIEVQHSHAGAFPRMRFLKPDATQLLLESSARDICTQSFEGMSIGRQEPSLQAAICKYITQTSPKPEDVKLVEGSGFWSETTKPYLFLLRGLFAGGILAFTFSRMRWRVNYGLTSTRQPPTKLAVPYRAKDSPTPRSEFSHPDTIIILTCCSYYFEGLSDADLFQTFDHLVDSDQAEAEYQGWLRESSYSGRAFNQLTSVNLRDTAQCKLEIFPHFQRTKRTIDYFLQAIVFPKHMREFPQKLSASGWDLGGLKAHPTTGFSGTNDFRFLLPLDVKQYNEKPNSAQAAVLGHILGSETNIVCLPSPSRRTSGTLPLQAQLSDAEVILEIVREQDDPDLRVILDVGAQILELTNAQVARRWLNSAHKQDATIEGAVYFNDEDEIMVISLTGITEQLRTSPFADRLDVCIIFLDEAHTRGVDLKLPSHYRAAVLLGTGVTRDKFVQACMRMRRLGPGEQSLTLCMPPEVQSKIFESIPNLANCSANIKPFHIVFWAFTETMLDLSRSLPLWAQQGYRYHDHKTLWEQENMDLMTEVGAANFLEQESVTLEERYRPSSSNYTGSKGRVIRQGDTYWETQIRQRFADLAMERGLDESTFQEEQERELAPEAEEQKQTEGPGPAKAAEHVLHRDLRTFVSSGMIAPGSAAFMPAFQSLRDTTAAKYLKPEQLPQKILVTADFASTSESKYRSEERRKLFVSDAFQRPVQWILTSQPASWDFVVIISPFEAQELLPDIRKSGKTTLHVYAPRPSLDIDPLDDLKLFSVPSATTHQSPLPMELAVQLNLFAGQLYFKSFGEYVQLCKILRLAWKQADDGDCIEADGFLRSATSQIGMDVIKASTLEKSPINFLRTFLSKSRRDGQAIGKTHLGKLLDGAQFQTKELDGDEDVEMSG